MNTDRNIALAVALFHATRGIEKPAFQVEEIGCGSYRTAYLVGDLVYKVGRVGTNSEEADRVMEVRPRLNGTVCEGFTVRIPDCAFMQWDKGDGIPDHDWHSVSVMEYAGPGCQFTNCAATYPIRYGTHPKYDACNCEPESHGGMCWGALHRFGRVTRDWGISDMHAENLLYQGMRNELWAIDLQY